MLNEIIEFHRDKLRISTVFFLEWIFHHISAVKELFSIMPILIVVGVTFAILKSPIQLMYGMLDWESDRLKSLAKMLEDIYLRMPDKRINEPAKETV